MPHRTFHQVIVWFIIVGGFWEPNHTPLATMEDMSIGHKSLIPLDHFLSLGYCVVHSMGC